MASTMIHMVVANEVNKVLKRNRDKFLIGSIAPDVSKIIGESKINSHFLDNKDDDVPNINRFLMKYRNNLDDDFVLGYFVHLYTDYFWFKYFLPEIYNNSTNMIKRIDGSIVKCDQSTLENYIYNDYTDLNIRLLDEYNMDLKIFYNEIPYIDDIIKEIPMDKIQIIIDKAAFIIENSKKNKNFIFNIDNIKVFISTCTNLILLKIKELNLM